MGERQRDESFWRRGNRQQAGRSNAEIRRGVPQPERIYLFGSMARDEAGSDSDHDLLVVVPDDVPHEWRSSKLAYESL